MTLSILVLAGSAVDEFHADLSRVYASGFLGAIGDRPEYRFVLAYVTPGGDWSFPDDLNTASISAAQTYSLPEALELLRRHHLDAMVPQMFCLPGMTTYRSLFDLLHIPFVGNTSPVMAMTADKNLARAVVAAAGVDVPHGQLVRAGERVDEVREAVVVKPVDSDNSMGVTLVREGEDLASAVAEALTYSAAALVESYVPLGREVRCGIIVRGGELVCLPLEEYAVDETSKPIRDHADKLNRTEDGNLYLVAKEQTRAWTVPVGDPITGRVWAAARAAHVALGCRHYSLFDFRVDPDGRPWFLEASLYCSYSPTSVLAVMARAAGIDVAQLFADSLKELPS